MNIIGTEPPSVVPICVLPNCLEVQPATYAEFWIFQLNLVSITIHFSLTSIMIRNWGVAIAIKSQCHNTLIRLKFNAIYFRQNIHMTGKSISNVKNRIYSLLMHLQKCQLYFLEQHSKSCQMCRTVARVNPFITKLGSVFIVVCAWCSTIWLMWIRRPVMQCCKSQNKEVQTPGCDIAVFTHWTNGKLFVVCMRL